MFITGHWYIWLALMIIGGVYAALAVARSLPNMTAIPVTFTGNRWFPLATKYEVVETLIALAIGLLGLVLLVIAAVGNFAGFLLQM